MKLFLILLFIIGNLFYSQDIRGVQLFNPQTNDTTPVIALGEQLVLRFDDFSNASHVFRYTIRHCDRNWQPDTLFFSEYAEGSLSVLLDDFQYSFNTLQKYTHYNLVFPNERLRPKISGNFQLIVYLDEEDNPLFIKRFSVVENGASLLLQVSRWQDALSPKNNQRVEVQATASSNVLVANANRITMTLVQNNNWQTVKENIKPSTSVGNNLIFQQTDLTFPGNNEYYYFDNKNMNRGLDMVAGGEILEGQNHTYLHPVWAFPLNYQYQPDVNGAFYFRRNDLGIERDANREADYSWVYFALDSEPTNRELYVVGSFNDYEIKKQFKMQYDETRKQYVAKIYLKQGFYNYLIASLTEDGNLDYGEVNGNFWQTENLYQAYLYYKPFGRNFDGLLGYGEYRTPVQ